MNNRKNVSKSDTIVYDKCLSCQKRQVGCHSSCKAYLAMRDNARRARAERMKQSREAGDVFSVRFGYQVKNDRARRKRR